MMQKQLNLHPYISLVPLLLSTEISIDNELFNPRIVFVHFYGKLIISDYFYWAKQLKTHED